MQVALTDPNAEPLRESQRQLNRVQAEQLRLLVSYVEHFLREVEMTEPELVRTTRGRATAESAAIMNAAEALGAGEGHVHTQYQQACFARQHLPRVWGAVRAGDVPVRSLVRVISAADRLVSPIHRERLDVAAADYALTHRPARLSAWLNRYVARTEPDQHLHRCRRSHAERRVWLEHLEDGVSILHAMLPTLTAEAIKNRLVDVARSPKQDVPYDPCVERPVMESPGESGELGGAGTTPGIGGAAPTGGPGRFDWLGLASEGSEGGVDLGREAATPAPVEGLAAAASEGSGGLVPAPMSREAGDPRTQAQREADLVANWLLTGQTEAGIPINAHVGILIEPATLMSGSDRPAISRNRRHTYPAEMIRRIILSEEHQIIWTPVPISKQRPDPPAVTFTPPDTRPERTESPAATATAAPTDPPVATTLTEPPVATTPTGPPVGALGPLHRVYESRFVPQLLRRAIEFRDGTCQAPGCMVAAEHCDIDHQIPWPHGETTAANLWALCRKHHRLKTAGFLDVPQDRPPPTNP
ncbi:DUF222 domain-containing protein [Nesterenkonia sp. CF4.4]|uniref:HNH endonuclease signature motif containing protein n=1 Tax=Nesterenkonia sp. CF4.4 TaxID=3373079 RepID=UPI003EE7ED15